MVSSTPFLPRIYYFYPQLVGASELDAHLDRCKMMGFDHVLIPAVSEAGGANWQEAAGALPRACKTRKLSLLVDIDLNSMSTDQSLADAHPDWFFSSEPSDDDLPDPRRPFTTFASERKNALRVDQPDVAEAILRYWQQTTASWIKAGAAGFRCVGIGQLPAASWRELIESVRRGTPAARFLAWTPGCTPQQLAALTGCGFDSTFSSGAWWDYRGRWLAEEQARLLGVAPPIAFPDAPNEAVIARAPGHEDMRTRRHVYQRALRLAACIGNGILIPMGFEHGLAGQHNPAQDASGFSAARANAPFDLSDDIAQANALVAETGKKFYAAELRMLTGSKSSVAVLLRTAPSDHKSTGATGATDDALLIVANPDPAQSCTVDERLLLERAEGFVRYTRSWPDIGGGTGADQPVVLAPGELQLFAARRIPPIVQPGARNKQPATAAARAPRIAIEAIAPAVDDGRFPVKRTVGESVDVEADILLDGHDKLTALLLWRAADEPDWHEIRMHHVVNDRWRATLPLTRVGKVLFAIEAWRDAFATYRDELEKKTDAGLNVGVELEEGRLLVEAAAEHAQASGMADTAATLKALAKSLKVAQSRDKSKAAAHDAERDAKRIAALLSEATATAMRQADARPFMVRSEPALRIDAERTAARFSSWYELFPRSQSGDPKRHGTFADVEKRLPAIAAMGFDTLYFTPIHPIGTTHRKGRNNSLTPAPDDPGSPYAIGSDEGGHDAIHAELGTLQDFRHLRDEAARHGLELALDFAIQCSPDHPWLKEHPEWFDWRPDGTIRYAENPPKKYQDIVNVDFYADGAIPGLWNALRDVVLFWVKQGVRVFRVDNPHTKPLPFWEWMIADIRNRYPDTIFLSEAFTRPKMMYRLAKVGFSQSYTYFTWRHTKAEFTDYLTELTTTSVREHFRPHFFVNTPDINPPFLQKSGRPGFLIRAALATTLSGLWGMYSGFELCDATPVPGKEEYLDSEKYEIRAWDWNRPGNIVAEITLLNRMRRQNPALQTHLGVRFLPASNENVLYFLKTTEPIDRHDLLGDNVILVAINLDPFAAHESDIELPLWEFGLPDDGALDADDLIGGGHFVWHGKHQHIRLDPFDLPFAIWRIRPQGN
jgi:starch synthase (maltosyl-transferring)